MYSKSNIYFNFTLSFTVQAFKIKTTIFKENFLYFYTKKDIDDGTVVKVARIINEHW